MSNFGSVYVIECENSVKIGCSRSPQKRVLSLINTLGLNKNARVFISNDTIDWFRDERTVHERFDDYRCIGEYFNVDFSMAVKFFKKTCPLLSPEAVNARNIEVEKNSAKFISTAGKMIKEIMPTINNASVSSEYIAEMHARVGYCNDVSVIDALETCITEMDFLLVWERASVIIIDRLHGDIIDVLSKSNELISKFKLDV